MTTDEQIRQAFMRREPAKAKAIRHQALRDEVEAQRLATAAQPQQHPNFLRDAIYAAGCVCGLLLAFAWCFVMLFAAGSV